MVLCVPFKSVTYFEVIFTKGLRSVSRFLFFACGYSIPAPFGEKNYLFFPLHWITFAPLSKINWLYLCGSISWFSILLNWFISVPTDTIEYCGFTVLNIVALHLVLKQGSMILPTSFFFSQNCSGYPHFFAFPCKF